MNKISNKISLLACVLFFLPLQVRAETKSIDTFSAYQAGSFPAWKTYPFYKGKAKKVYQVKNEGGNKYLSAYDDKDISVPIFKSFSWDLKKYPILKFRWRALTLPAGAKETQKSTNDSACGIYVGFGSKLSGVAQKYVWSTGAPLGHVWEKDKNKFFVIVKKTGSAGLKGWHHVTVNVAQDYRKFFKTDQLRNPFGIGVLTDGNAVHKTAACDYDDFRVSN